MKSLKGISLSRCAVFGLETTTHSHHPSQTETQYPVLKEFQKSWVAKDYMKAVWKTQYGKVGSWVTYVCLSVLITNSGAEEN